MQGTSSCSTSYLTLLPPSELGLVNHFNRDAELVSDTGRELGLPALTHQIYPTTRRDLPIPFDHGSSRSFGFLINLP